MDWGTAVWARLRARGHPNVRARHRTTLEVTAEDYLTPRGDCIVAVGAEAGAAGLPGPLKEAIRSWGLVVLVICSGGVCDSVVGAGHPGLSLSDPLRLVARRSTYIDGKTFMICASKAARGLDRGLVANLRRGLNAVVTIIAVPGAGLDLCPGLLRGDARPAGGGGGDA